MVVATVDAPSGDRYFLCNFFCTFFAQVRAGAVHTSWGISRTSTVAMAPFGTVRAEWCHRVKYGAPQRHITLNYLDRLGNFSTLMGDDNPLCILAVFLHTTSVQNFGVVFRNFLHFNSIRNIKHNNVFALAFLIHFRSDQCFSKCTNGSDPVKNVKVFAFHVHVLSTMSHFKCFISINIRCCAQYLFDPLVFFATGGGGVSW